LTKSLDELGEASREHPETVDELLELLESFAKHAKTASQLAFRAYARVAVADERKLLEAEA